MSDTNLANNTATDDDFLACSNYGTSSGAIVADGRAGTRVLAPAASVFFVASLRAGASYAAEFANVTGTFAPTLTVFRGDDGCSNTSTATLRDTVTIEPAASAAARVSFTASGTDLRYRFRLANPSGAPLSVAFRVGETTAFSAAWSTAGTFDTYYSLQNTTGVTINGTLILRDLTGATMTTFALAIPAGRTSATNTSALATARGKAGTATFTHDGPAGAVLATAAVANFTTPVPYIQPVKFEALRSVR